MQTIKSISLKGKKTSATVFCNNLIKDGRKIIFLTAYGPSQEIGAFAQLLSDGEAKLYFQGKTEPDSSDDDNSDSPSSVLNPYPCSTPQIIPKIENGYSGLYVLPTRSESVIVCNTPEECFDIYGRILDQQQFVHRDWYKPMFDLASELIPEIGAKVCFRYASDPTQEVKQRLDSGEFSFPEPTANLTVETMEDKQEREEAERELSNSTSGNPVDDDSDEESFWGEPISTYSRAQAIEDGTLIDLSSPMLSLESGKSNPADVSELTRQLYKYPVACTSAVWGIVERAVASKNHCNDIRGVMWDILLMSQKGITQKIDDSQHLFQVIITGAGRKKIHTFRLICGPGDNMEPVITIMLPEED